MYCDIPGSRKVCAVCRFRQDPNLAKEQGGKVMGKQKKKLFYSLGTAISIFCMIFCINLKVHAEGIIITPETFENYYL